MKIKSNEQQFSINLSFEINCNYWKNLQHYSAFPDQYNDLDSPLYYYKKLLLLNLYINFAYSTHTSFHFEKKIYILPPMKFSHAVCANMKSLNVSQCRYIYLGRHWYENILMKIKDKQVKFLQAFNPPLSLI